ncbi:MAG: sensor histidine kinase [Algoriphagus sp.]|uniref:tetratricopeptide repeat-containing sensor histidine kinase n=1 Tax=Algoriphagus sp. TaxID=1872435 RepID=UPI00260D5673|nr:sensor histidine kinase [Algoriphagus sp.]MDG1276456.1 sensor histidine kinase [Algoriphagus sp.]
MRVIGIIIICLCSFSSYGQTSLIDSLQNILTQQPDDSTKASVMGDLCWHLKYSDPPKALEYGHESIQISKKNGYQALQAYASNNVGVVFWAKSDYDSAAYYLDQTRELYTSLDNERGVAVTSVNLGLILQNKGDYDASLEYQLEALRIVTKIDDQGLKGSVLTNIGNVHFLNEKFDKAKAYYFDALRLKQSLPDDDFRQNIQKTLLNIGNVYGRLDAQDSAIYYYQEALPYAIKANDSKSQALIYTDLGHAYSKKKEYNLAGDFFKKALAVYSEGKYENDYDQSILLWSMGENELRRNNISAAVTLAEQSLALSKKIENLNRLRDSYGLLAEVYEANNQFGSALQAHKFHKIYEDSLLNIDTNSKIAELETKYETEKKDQQILLLDQENSLQKANNDRNTLLIVGLLLVLLLLILIFYLWRKQSRINQQKVLSEQKTRLREAQIQAVISSEEKERKRFASDLHDSMGQLVSALTMNIQGLKNTGNDPLVRHEIVDNSTVLLNDIQREIRNIAFNLMPQVLTKEGLIPALEELCGRISKSNQVKASIQAFGIDTRLNEVFEISLYRILQEWVSNLLKYSGATELLIQFVSHENEIVITVEDNGTGFDLKTFETSSGNGWRNINTRLNLIKGTLDIDTQPGRRNSTLMLSIDSKLAFTPTQVAVNT